MERALSAFCGVLAVFLFFTIGVTAITIDEALIWTEKSLDGVVYIRGLPGNPQDWIDHGIPDYVTYGIPSDPAVQYKSVRVALGFRHSTRELIYSDVGYREIVKMRLAEVDDGDRSVNATVEPLYTGISSRARGVAVDWQAANVYWTDSAYNWITVAAMDRREMYRHIVTTDLDIPLGIAVYPQKGLLFWTDQGVRPKIERSQLDGSGRRVIHDSNIYKPTGITVDYGENQVFWIDDFLNSVFRMSIDGENIRGFKVEDKTGSNFQYLDGIVTYQNFIFITDQFMMNIKIYDKDLLITRGDIQLKLSVPYDVMMYEAGLQADFPSECNTLDCEHICTNMGNGKARCICGQGYILNEDLFTCKRQGSFTKPEYIYSMGSTICSSHVKMADLDPDVPATVRDMECLKDRFGYVEALTADVNGNLLFFSDTKSSRIRRVRLDNEDVVEDHLLQAGVVKGLSVDWINNNLYWTDEVNGQIIVSKYDGTLTKIVLGRLQQPQGLVVDPVNGYMYWSTLDAIYSAYLDGSNAEVFVSQGVHAPEGMAVNYRDMRLYWVDSVAGGISSIRLNGTDQRELYKNTDKTYRDIAVYQDYLAWTDGKGGISFCHVTEDGQLNDVKRINSDNDDTSTGIVTFDGSTQPMSSDGACIKQLCTQLCLATPDGATCHCTTGFRLDSDGKTCVSALKARNFLIFSDPLHRIFYQLDAMSLDRRAPLEGVLLPGSGSPSLIAYDVIEGILYWYDSESREIKRKVFQRTNGPEYIVLRLSPGSHVGSMHIDQGNDILYYTETTSKSINSISLMDITQVKTVLTENIVPEAFTVDVNSGWMFWLVQRPDKLFTIWRSRTNELPMRAVVIDGLKEPEIRGLTVDSKESVLYWWDRYTIWSVSMAGTDMKIYPNLPTADIISVAAYGGHLYISDREQRYLTKYNTQTAAVDILTDPLFSRIESIRIFMSNFEQDSQISPATFKTGSWNYGPTPEVAPPDSAQHLSSTKKSSTNVVLASGLSALVVVVVVVVIIVVVMHRRRRTKRPPSAEFNADAHENPTYMRADEVPERTSVNTSPITSDPTRLGDVTNGRDVTSDVSGQQIVPTSGSGDVTSAGDTVTLVRHMADQSEVTLQMGTAADTAAAYTAEREQ